MQKQELRRDLVRQACGPSTGRLRKDGYEFKASLGYVVRYMVNPVSHKTEIMLQRKS